MVACGPIRRLLSLAALAACGISAHCVAAPAMDPREALSNLGDVAGPWDITSFDGHQPQRLDVDGQRHAFVDISETGLSFTIGCNYSGAAGRIDQVGRFIVTNADSVTTAMGCGVEREHQDQAFFSFFRAEPRVTRSGQDLIFETADTQLVLQRPEVRRASALLRALEEIDGRWRAPIIYFQSEPGNNRNLIAWLDGAPANVEFGPGAAHLFFDCERVQSEVSLLAPGALRFTTPQRQNQGACRIPVSDRDLAATLFSGPAEIEWVDRDRVRLANDRVSAVLERDRS